jgi:hypothetical protein
MWQCEENATYAAEMCTREVGGYPNTKCFTTNVPVIVGVYLKMRNEGGYGDNAEASELFVDNNGVVTRVKLDYLGKTCFVKVDEPSSTQYICDTYVRQENDPNISFECQTCSFLIDACKCT